MSRGIHTRKIYDGIGHFATRQWVENRTLLIEAKSHVSCADLAAFARKAQLYEQQTGTPAARMVVSPSVEPRALQMAEDLGVKVSTSLA